MTSNSSSRTALAIVAVLVAAVIVWFFLMRNEDTQPSNTQQITENANTNVAERSTSIPSESSDDTKSTSQSVSEKTQAKTIESNPTRAESRDFRVSAEDKYASVPKGRFFTTTGISDLTPDEQVRSFRIGRQVYAYAAIHAPRKETVRITWLDSNGKEIPPSAYLDVLMNTGPVGYRVFTYRTFRSPGKYAVKLTNSVGVEIGEGQFEVYE